MHAVIPLRNNDDGRFLRYALRALLLVYPDMQPIVVGGKPRWYTGQHIPHKDYPHERKEENIRDKVLAAGVDEFLFMNDDHFLLAPVSSTWNKGLLSESIAHRNPNGSYSRLLRNTLNHYGDAPNADTHCPMWMSFEGVQRTAFEWPKFGLGFKTCYCQENGVQSEYYPDIKLDRPVDVSGRLWFSTSDIFPTKALQKMFPDSCKFETIAIP